jgi:hypothetical protein
MSPVLRLVVQDQNRGAADQQQADAMSFDNVVRGRFEIFRLDYWIVLTVSDDADDRRSARHKGRPQWVLPIHARRAPLRLL